MGRTKTFVPGGQVFPADLNAIEDAYELAFSSYRSVVPFTGGPTDGTSLTVARSPLWLQTLGPGSGAGAGEVQPGAFWLDPADFAAGSRAVKLRLRAVLAVNAVAPGVSLTFGLHPLTVSYGASNNINSYTRGAAVTGSTVLYTTPAANSGPTVGVSGDFTPPTPGFYCLGLVSSGSATTTSRLDVRAQLQFREV